MTVTGVDPEQVAVSVPTGDPAELLRSPYPWVPREYMLFVSMVINHTKFTPSQAMEAFHKFLAFADNSEEDDNPRYPQATMFIMYIIAHFGICITDESPECKMLVKKHIMLFAISELQRRGKIESK